MRVTARGRAVRSEVRRSALTDNGNDPVAQPARNNGLKDDTYGAGGISSTVVQTAAWSE
jgi:hypothetical protein